MKASDRFDKYIAATRRSLEGRLEPQLYTSHFRLSSGLLLASECRADLRLIYTSERRSEAVTHDGSTAILYDQYLGQTLSSLSRIVYEAPNTNFALNYIAKMLAEFFRAFGAHRDAYICARVHSDEETKLRKLTRGSAERGVSVFYQERFLIFHETYHLILARDPRLRFSVTEVLDDYLSYVKGQPEQVQEIFPEFAENISEYYAMYPKAYPVSLLNEMACDLFSFMMTVASAQDRKILGRHEKEFAALSCLEALKNSQVIHSLRDSVIHRVRALSNEALPSVQEILYSYQERFRFLNWFCNSEMGQERVGSDRVWIHTDTYLNNFHDRLALVSNSIVAAISQDQFDGLFAETAEYIDDLLLSGKITTEVAAETVDAMTGWFPAPPLARERAVASDRWKFQRLLSQLKKSIRPKRE